MRLSRNKSCWDFKLLGLVQFVSTLGKCLLEQCATCIAPLGLQPVGASKNVMPSSPSQLMPGAEFSRSKVTQCADSGVLAHTGTGGTAWFEIAIFWTLGWSLHCFLPASRFLRISDPAQPSTRFSKDLFFPQGLDFGDETKLLTWLQIGPGPTFLSFHHLRMPLALLRLPPFLIHCSPEDNKHFRNCFRDSPQGENKETQRQQPNQQTAEPGINSHGKPVFVYY